MCLKYQHGKLNLDLTSRLLADVVSHNPSVSELQVVFSVVLS